MLSRLYKRLDFRIIVVSIIIIFLPAGISLGILGTHLKNTYRQATLEKFRSELEIKAHKTTKLLKILKTEISFLAKDIENLVETTAGTEDTCGENALHEDVHIKCLALLNSVIREDENITTIRIINPDGQEMIRLDRTDKGIIDIKGKELQNKSHRPYFEHFLNDPVDEVHATPISLNMEHGKIVRPFLPIIRLGKRLKTADGILFGILVLSVHKDFFFSSPDNAKNTGFLILDSEGYYIKCHDKSLLYGKELGHNANIFTKEPELKVNLQKQDSKIHFDKEEGEFRVWKKVFFDHGEKLYWVFMERHSANSIVAPWYGMVRLELSILLTLLVVSLGLYFIFIQRLLSPLRELSTAMTHIGEGNLSARIKTKSETEVGDIARVFDNMAERLEETAKALYRTMAIEGIVSDIAPNGHVVADKQGNIISVNPAITKIFAYTEEELIGQNVKIFVASPHKEKHDGYISDFFKRGYPKILGGRAEVTGVRKNGESFPVALYLDMAEVDGTTLIVGIIEDVTKQKEADRELGQWAEIFKNAEFGVAICSRDGKKIEQCNPAYPKMLGYSMEEFVGKNIVDLYAPEYKDRLGKYIEAVNKTGHHQFEALQIKKDSTTIPVFIDLTAVKDEKGNVLYRVANVLDITKRKKAEEDIKSARKWAEQSAEELKKTLLVSEQLRVEAQEASKEAKKASSAKTDFLASMSHEIRTPMNAIIGMADLLSETCLTKEQEQYISTFRYAGESLLNIINDILDLSKIEAGRMELEEVPFNLQELIDRTGEIMVIQAEAKGLSLSTMLDPETPTALLGDPTRLRQILINLAGNAVKFTDEGDVLISVEARKVKDEDMELLFSVKDTGIGIPKEKHKQIFESFSQADTSVTRTHGGTGLGLSISNLIVHAMGGCMCLESEVGKGSNFYFSIRIKRGEEATGLDKPMDVDLTGVRVLVIDDSAVNRMILNRLMTYWHGEIDEAENGKLALEKMLKAKEEGNPYQLVMLDYMMPDMDGFEVARKIKGNPEINTPIILNTSSIGYAKGLKMSKEVGIECYIQKPIKQSELRLNINLALGRIVDSKVKALATKSGLSLSPLKILLVDDNVDNRNLIVAYLKRSPHGIDIAENGEIAVEKFMSGRYDLVLMDIEMPVMDGYTATQKMREWEKEQSAEPTQIIALTAHALKEHEEKSREAGCDRFLTKPIKKAKLLEAINKESKKR